MQSQERFVLSQGLNKKSKHWHLKISFPSFPQVFRVVIRVTSIFISNKSAIDGAHVTPSLMPACGTVVEAAGQIHLHFLKERLNLSENSLFSKNLRFHGNQLPSNYRAHILAFSSFFSNLKLIIRIVLQHFSMPLCSFISYKWYYFTFHLNIM